MNTRAANSVNATAGALSSLPLIEGLPGSWESVKAKWLFHESKQRGIDDEPLLSVTQSHGIVARDESELRVWNPGDDVSSYKLVKPGDFVISLRSFQGGIEWSATRGIVSPAYVVLRRKRQIVDDYYRHLLKSHPLISALAVVSSGIRQGKTISYSEFAEITLPLPPTPAQRAIADFLDRETARIDALIAKKERLIELLEEKRTALITRAVTKGLEPDVEMKDSGVEWLGEIPAHWDAIPLGRMVAAVSGGTPDRGERRYWDGEIPWVSPKDMKVLDINASEETITEAALKESSLKLLNPPAVLIVVRGMILDHTFPVARALRPVTINQDMKALLPRDGLNAEYLSWALSGLGDAMLANVERAAHGTCKLRSEHWKALTIPRPGLREQVKTSKYLRATAEKLDRVLQKIHRAKILLREYRTALITAAVTGQIDVREAAP